VTASPYDDRKLAAERTPLRGVRHAHVGQCARPIVAPQISKFTSATIRDMSAVDVEQQDWLANFILNSLLRTDVWTPQRQQLFNLLRRSHATFDSYARARESTLEYLTDTQRNLKYIGAIGHWEAFLGYAWQAPNCLSGNKAIWFKKGDGSELERFNALYNRAKHAAEAIERGDFIEDSPLCVWLTNDGLCSTNALTFDEIAEILDGIARYASAAGPSDDVGASPRWRPSAASGNLRPLDRLGLGHNLT